MPAQFSDNILFQSNIPGGSNKGLQTNMEITDFGQVLIGGDYLSGNFRSDDASRQLLITHTSSRSVTPRGTILAALPLTFTNPLIARDPAPAAARLPCSRGWSPPFRKHTRLRG